MGRVTKPVYYLGIAEAVSERSTCMRRQYGAVIVKNDRIISTGYNGSARGCENCCDRGVCKRESLGVPHGERYELCEAVHAECNAIINADPADLVGSTLYLFGREGMNAIDAKPCMMCERIIKNAQIQRLVRNNPNDGEFFMPEVFDFKHC